MDSHVKEHFRQYSEETPSAHFHKVISLHDDNRYQWGDIHRMVPKMCKGWFELSKLKPSDRIEFIREFWNSKLKYRPDLTKSLNDFFSLLDDIGIFITQQRFDDPYDAQLVYSLKGDSGYYHGLIPATEDDIRSLQKMFPEYTFPLDYLAFMQIHNGFSKGTDTGIIPTYQMWGSYQQFQSALALEDAITTLSGEIVDSNNLIPFYESFGMPFYQCFWASWYPQEEMGNVYYSGLTKKIPDVKDIILGEESMAFPTFIDWLMFYLELIDKET